MKNEETLRDRLYQNHFLPQHWYLNERDCTRAKFEGYSSQFRKKLHMQFQQNVFMLDSINTFCSNRKLLANTTAM